MFASWVGEMGFAVEVVGETGFGMGERERLGRGEEEVWDREGRSCMGFAVGAWMAVQALALLRCLVD